MGEVKEAAVQLLEKHRGWFKGAGALMLVLGIAAITVPFVATLAVEFLVAWLFIVAGFVLALQACMSHGWRGFLLNLALGLLYLVAGFFLLLYPLAGALTLTAVLAAFFLVQGAFRIVLALQIRSYPNWGWMWVSGLATILLGVLVYGSLPGSASWAIGLLVGIDFVFGGTGLLLLGSGKAAEETSSK